MANSADPDETAHNEPSHLDLQFAKVSVWVYKAESVFILKFQQAHLNAVHSD